MEIKLELKGAGKDKNYKYCVSAVIGEKKGQGVQAGSYCAWDIDTDTWLSHWYSNEILFWLITIFTSYRYPTMGKE